MNMDAPTILRRPLSVAMVFLGTLMILGALWLLAGQSQPAYPGHLPTHQFPSATVKVWDTGAPIGGISLGATPGESIEDPTGLTGHGTTSPTIVTLYARSSHPQGLSGVSYWNPDANSFVWYGKTLANPLGDLAPFPGGVDINRVAPVRSGPSPVFGSVTFGPGDVWVGGLQIQQPLYMHFAGTNRFRTYGVNSPTDRAANRIWGVKLDQSTGDVFVAVPDLGEIARLNPVTAQVTAWVVGGTNFGPAGLTLDSQGRPFTTLSRQDIVLRLDPGPDGVLGTADDVGTFWRVPNRDGIRSFRDVPPAVPVLQEEYPNAIITTDTDGNVWFTESNSNEIGRLSAGPDGVLGTADDVICEYTKPGLSNPQQIASTGSGSLLQVYFTEGEGNSVSVLTQAEADLAGEPTRVCTTVPAETAAAEVFAGAIAGRRSLWARSAARDGLMAPEPIEEGAPARLLRRSAVAVARAMGAVGPTRLLPRNEHVRDCEQPSLALLGVLQLLAQVRHERLGIG